MKWHVDKQIGCTLKNNNKPSHVFGVWHIYDSSTSVAEFMLGLRELFYDFVRATGCVHD